MPRLTMEVPHALGQDEAMGRLKEKFSMAKSMYQQHVTDLHEEWQDHTYTFRFKTMAIKVAGTITVAAAAVTMVLELPLAALVFKGAIEKRVRQELETLLA